MKTCAFITLGCKVNQYETQETHHKKKSFIEESPLTAYLEGVALHDGEGGVKQCQIAVVDITKQKKARQSAAG